MHRISRIYIGNYGHKMCWYDGLLFNFVDEQTGEPTDCILQLENGGGKSTLLAGIFSCFDTAQNRFLKHLQQPRNRFSDYFSEDGLPGFILLEWMIPTAGPHRHRRIITGQVVSMKNRVTSELERIFFSFETAPDLALESIPAPKLSAQPSLSMDDFTRWLSRIKREYKGNVFETRNQTDWEHHLEHERGIDVGMLKLQVEFSRVEGSIDTAFLNFRNETEFLQKFLYLTMDAEQAAAVRNSVITACDKLKRKPEFEKRHSVLSELLEKLSEFKESATGMLAAKKNFGGYVGQSARLTSTLFAASKGLTTQADLCIETSRDLKEAINELQNKKIGLVRSLAGAEYLHLKRKSEQSRTVTAACEEALHFVDDQIRYLRAAKLFGSIEALRAQKREVSATVELAEQGLQPLLDRARIQGKILKELLLQHKQKSLDDVANAENASNRNKEERKRLKCLLVELAQRISNEERSFAHLQNEHKRYDEKRRYWSDHGLLNSSDDLLTYGVTRVDEQIASHSNALTTNEELILKCERSIKDFGAQISSAEQQIAGKEEATRNLNEIISEAEAVRDEISQDRALCRAAESESIDPDADLIQPFLDKYIAELQRTRDGYAVIVAQLNGNRTEIDTTGLAGLDPDVHKLVALLSEFGVTTVCAYNTYVAQTEPNATKARDLVCSDPAKFLGVAVKTAKELELARQVLEVPSTLSRPIVVSLITNQASTFESSFVVPPQNDAAYSFESAKHYAAQLQERLTQQHTLFDEHEKLVIDAIQSRQKLHDYRERFGKHRLSDLRADLKVKEGELGELRVTADGLQDEIKNGYVLREIATKAAQIERDELKRLAGILPLLARDYEELEKPAVARSAEMANAKNRLDALEEQRELAVESEEQVNLAYHTSEQTARDCKRHTEDLNIEILRIRQCDDSFDASASLSREPIPLEAARQLYESAANTLDYEERNQLGVLKNELENTEKLLFEKDKEYSTEYGALDEMRVRAALPLDFIAESARLEDDRLKASAEFERAKYDRAAAENELKSFKKKQPESESASFAHVDLSEESLLLHLDRTPVEISVCDADLQHHEYEVRELSDKERTHRSHAELYTSAAKQLEATIDSFEAFDPDATLLPHEPKQVMDVVVLLIKETRSAQGSLNKAQKRADLKYQAVQKSVFSQELREVEPEITMLLTNYDFDQACEAAERLFDGVADRVAVALNWLESLKADFDATVQELHNLAIEGIRIITSACNKRIPEKAPYLGGKPVIKMKANLSSINTEHRRSVLEDFMDNIIRTGMPHALGTDMVADAIQKMAGKNLGISIAKLIREESEQYASADKLSNSGGEAVSMALFLYILTAQIRAEMQADRSRQPGGPLILDNPFAKASSPFIWRAQRAFAQAMGVQLIFATPTKDLETLGEFEHFIYLRKAGQNNKTGRYHIEQVDLALVRTS